MASIEGNHSKDLLCQAEYRVIQAQTKFIDEQKLLNKQEKERKAFEIKQTQEQANKLKILEELKKQKLILRQEYKEKTKNAIVFEKKHFFEENKRKQKFDGNTSPKLSGSKKIKNRLVFTMLLILIICV